MLAPNKHESDVKSAWIDFAKINKNKKSNKGTNQTPKEFVQVDFRMIKIFSPLTFCSFKSRGL
jgi:hypothetical protein